MPSFLRYVRKTLLPVLALLDILFVSSSAFAEPTYRVSRRSFADANANGLIDCGEIVTLQVVVFDLDPPRDVEATGRITFPSDFPARWSFLAGSVQQDHAFSAKCFPTIVRGNGSNDGGAIIDYSCRLPSSEPESRGYVLTMLLQGFYSGPSGSIRIPSQHETFSPTALIQQDVYSDTLVASCATPDLALSKSDGGAAATRGQTLVYNLSYVNNGSATATNTTLTETVPANTTFNPAASSPGWTCSAPDEGSLCTLVHGGLVPGGSGTKAFAVDVKTTTPAAIANLSNTATITSAVADANSADNTATDTTPLVPGAPDLVLSKTFSGSAASPGSIATSTLTVTNAGNGWALNANINDSLPAHATFSAAASSSGWSCAGSSCSISLGDLAPGATVSRTFSVRIDNPLPASVSDLINTACASTASPGDPQANNCASATTPINAAPSLSLSKTLASGTGTPGATVVYNLTLTNSGNQAASGIVLTETVPQHTTFSAAASHPAWSCSSTSAGSSCSLNITHLDGAGASATRAFAVVVANPLPGSATTIRNTACAGSTCSTIEVPTDGSPRLSLSKTAISGTTSPGDVLVYRIDVQNTGNQAAADVTLREVVPQNTTFHLASSNPAWSCSSTAAGSPCTLPLDEVPAGGTLVSRLFAVRIDNPLPAGTTTIANNVCASRPGSPDACSTLDIPSAGSPKLVLSKTLTGGTPAPGALLLYTVSVQNQGNQAAGLVTLSEVVPAGSTFAPASSSPGWSCSPSNTSGASCTLTLPTLPAGATESRQFAIALSDPFEGDHISNTACGSTEPSISVCSTTTHPIAGSPELHLTKSFSGPPLQPGALLVFTLTVSNSGTRAAHDLRLQETIPAASSFDAAHSDPRWSCTSPDPGSTCSLLLPQLASGASAPVAFAVRAVDPLPPGLRQISNAACLSTPAGDVLGCDDSATPLPTFVEATLDDSLATDQDEDGRLDAGDVLRYTLVVTNPSNSPATDITITTDIDAHLALVVGSVTSTDGTVASGSTPGDATVTIALPRLEPGATVEITFDVLALDLLGLEAVSSQARVRGANFEDEPSDDPATPDLDDDPTVTPLTGQPIPAIPTLGSLGLAGLVLALSLVGARRLRRPATP